MFSSVNRRLITVLSIITILIAIPLTVFLSQRAQNLRQHAATNGTVSFTEPNGNPLPGSIANPELYIKVTLPDGWTLPAQSKVTPKEFMSLIPKAYAAQCSDYTNCTSCTTAVEGCGWADNSRCIPGASAACPSGASTSWAYTTSQCTQAVVCTGAGGGTTPTPIQSGPTATPMPTPTPVACTPGWNSTDCSSAISPGHCSDWGSSSYCGWTLSLYQACQQRCASTPTATPIPGCPPGITGPGCPTPTPTPSASGSCPFPGDTCTYSQVDPGGTHCYSGHGATGFNVSGCTYSCGPIACPIGSGGAKVLQRIIVQNVGGGGHADFEAASGFSQWINNPFYWKLNPLIASENSASRTVEVTFVATDGTQLKTSASVTLTKPFTPTPTTPAPTTQPDALNCIRTNPANSISGTVYRDVNNDGQFDQSPPQKTPFVDQPLSGWTIVLKNSAGQVIARTTSNNSGTYTFNNVCDSTYKVSEDVQSGWTVVEPIGNEYTITISNGHGAAYADFGNVQGPVTSGGAPEIATCASVLINDQTPGSFPLELNKQYGVRITMENRDPRGIITNQAPWKAGTYKLSALGNTASDWRVAPTPPFALNREISPGGSETFTITITTPIAARDNIPFQWRMVNNQGQEFGAACDLKFNAGDFVTSGQTIIPIKVAFQEFVQAPITRQAGNPATRFSRQAQMELKLTQPVPGASSQQFLTQVTLQWQYQPTGGSFGFYQGIANFNALLPPGTNTYNITVWEKNHLKRTVASFVPITSGQQNQPVDGTANALLVGDVNHDNRIDISDHQILVNCFGGNTFSCGYQQDGDLDDNGVVDIFDYNWLIENFNKIGEP